ncbi:hypothetical protein P879_08604 [Paragonimus westermani]|uniref:Uncharacterized protein n=1 Tax=Paragonimus westermani TaxID=34504 RepID=A0A8T0DN39_9TREM|nr:hypothetical protein P879_08604 [Paragonimus westermani]
MEPPAQLLVYSGLFASTRSIDVPLKIFFTLLSFLLLFLVAAWHTSRKSYNRAPRGPEFVVSRVSDLFRLDLRDFLVSIGTNGNPVAFSGQLGRHNVLVVNDWKLINLYEQVENLDYFYSSAPKLLRRNWYGLLISDSTLSNRTELRTVLLHAFDTLPNHTYSSVGSFGVSLSGPGKHLLDNQVIRTPHDLDRWLWVLIAEFLFFNSPAFADSCMKSSSLHNLQPKSQFISQLALVITGLECYHIEGNTEATCARCFNGQFPNANELLSDLDQLFVPLIQYATEQYVLHMSLPETDGKLLGRTSGTFLDQLIRAHRYLESEGEYVKFLKTAHLVHSLAEVCLILRKSLSEHLRVLFAVLAQRPQWQLHILHDAVDTLHGELQSNYSKSLLLHQTHCIVWTKALVSEAMRFCSPGWPFACIRQAVRDGQLNNYEFAEGELIIFNQPAYLSDPELWARKSRDETSGADYGDESGDPSTGLSFDPTRFIGTGATADRMTQLCLPVHWARFLLMGYTVCIPNEVVHRLLTAILLNFFAAGWKVKLDSQDEDIQACSDLPIWLTSTLPPVRLFVSNQ